MEVAEDSGNCEPSAIVRRKVRHEFVTQFLSCTEPTFINSVHFFTSGHAVCSGSGSAGTVFSNMEVLGPKDVLEYEGKIASP